MNICVNCGMVFDMLLKNFIPNFNKVVNLNRISFIIVEIYLRTFFISTSKTNSQTNYLSQPQIPVTKHFKQQIHKQPIKVISKSKDPSMEKKP